MEKLSEKKYGKWMVMSRILRRVLFFAAVLLFIFLGALGFPVVQTFIAQRIVKYIQTQTGAQVSLGSVSVSFSGNIHLHNFELNDLKSDTLFYFKDLIIGVDWMRLMDNELLIHRIELDNAVANVSRSDSSDVFNYQFLIDFFASDGSKEETDSSPWLITVNNTTLTNVRASYFDGLGNMEASVSIDQLTVNNAFVDAEQMVVKVGDLQLSNATGRFDLLAGSLTNIDDNTEAKGVVEDSIAMVENTVFSDWHISANTLGFANVNLAYNNNHALPVEKGIDYNHLRIDGLVAKLGNVSMLPNGYFLRVDTLSLHEKSGWIVNELSVDAKFTNGEAQLENLVLVTPYSSLKGNAGLVYDNLGALSNDFWNCGVLAHIDPSTIAAHDVLVFAPMLSDYDWFSSLSQNNVAFQGNVQGTMNDITIDGLSVQGMEGTSVRSSLKVKGLPSVETIWYKANIVELKSCLDDLEAIRGTDIDTDLHLPQNYVFTGNVEGTVQKGSLDGRLASSLGTVKAKGFYQWEAPLGRDAFYVDFSTNNFRLDVLMHDTVFGNVSLAGSAKGVGLTGEQLSANGTLDVLGLEYAGYNYNSISTTASIASDSLTANVSGHDPNLLFDLDAGAKRVDSDYVAAVSVDLANANLYALGFADDHFSLATKIHGHGKMRSVNQFSAALRLDGLKIKSDSLPILLDSILLQVSAMPNRLEANVGSSLVDAHFESNISANELASVVDNAYRTYLGTGDSTTAYVDKNMALTMDVHLPQNVLQFFMPNMAKLEVKRIKGTYNSDNNALKLSVDVPQMIYNDFQFDTIMMAVNGENDRLKLDFGMKALVYDTLMVNQVRVEELLHKGTLHSAISIGDSALLPRYYFANELSPLPNGYQIRFKPNGLVLDGQPWKIDDSNVLEFENDGVVAKGFEFTNNNQMVGLTTSDTNYNLRFNQFKVENLLDVVEQPNGKSLLKGRLNGVLELPFKGTNVLADLEIKDLCVMDSLVGNLYANIKTRGDSMFVASRWENEPNSVDLTGIATQLATSPNFDLRLLLDFKNLNRLEHMTFGQLSELGGAVNGDIALKGTSNDYAMTGFVGFDATSFTLSSLNFKAKINDEKIVIDPSGFHFNDFSVQDKNQKELTLNGSVLTKDFLDYNYDLHLATKGFQPINSTIDDNPLFFGLLALDADVGLKGDLDNPKVNADLKINKSTDLTYRMPGSELKLVSSEGIVEFIDPTKVNDTLSIDLYDDILNDSIMMKLKGLDLSMNLVVEDGAKFRVDIDPTSGDYLSFSGKSALNLSSDITGKQSITGIYEVSDGIYQLSFYGMVKKSFGIVPGSTISWSGRPMDADLNINASYEVRASSTALLSQEVTTMTEGDKNAYKQPLPYTVKLAIRGFLAQPEISFGLGLPDKYLVAYPLLANKLNVLNTPEMASELNKQVFSLLVAGSFMPSSPMTSSSSTTSGMVTTAARNSVNGLLASQLNNMSAKYVQGIDLDFGLTSYEDYTAGTGNTRTELDVQVSKKLMNDRLEVEAMGSFNFDSEKEKTASTTTQQNTGEFAVSYLLTEDGVYKLRAYFQNAYDTFDGEYGYSGVALIFEREFDRSEKQLKKNAARVARKQLKKEKRGK